MAGIHHFKSFSIVTDGVDIKVDMSRIGDNINNAQFALDSAIMTSMVPFMPFQTGSFINETKAQSAAVAGTGVVVAAVPPMGRMLYEGKVMVDSQTGKGPMKISTGPNEFTFRYRKGAKLVPSSRPLSYSNGRTDHWFDKAKEKDLKNWVNVVKKETGK